MEKYNFEQIDERGTIDFSRGEILNRFEKLPSGVYKCAIKNIAPMMSKAVLEPLETKDNLLNFEGGIFDDFLKATEDFFSKRVVEIYSEMKICHKMGILLHGAHGTGKTSTAILLMKKLKQLYNAICIDFSDINIAMIKSIISNIRKVQDNPIIIFQDEFDSWVSGYEENYLTFLDGADSVGNFIFLGCTNYLNKIPDRIKHRKSRIKHLFEIKSLPDTVYEQYITDKMPSADKKVIKEFMFHAAENQLNIDQLKHAIIDHRVDGISIRKAIKNSLSITIDPAVTEEDDDLGLEEFNDENEL